MDLRGSMLSVTRPRKGPDSHVVDLRDRKSDGAAHDPKIVPVSTYATQSGFRGWTHGQQVVP